MGDRRDRGGSPKKGETTPVVRRGGGKDFFGLKGGRKSEVVKRGPHDRGSKDKDAIGREQKEGKSHTQPRPQRKTQTRKSGGGVEQVRNWEQKKGKGQLQRGEKNKKKLLINTRKEGIKSKRGCQLGPPREGAGGTKDEDTKRNECLS